MSSEIHQSNQTFGIDELVRRCQGGSCQVGWLESYGDYLRSLHRSMAAEIAAILADADATGLNAAEF